jgi:hypothetical protein
MSTLLLVDGRHYAMTGGSSSRPIRNSTDQPLKTRRTVHEAKHTQAREKFARMRIRAWLLATSSYEYVQANRERVPSLPLKFRRFNEL